MIISDERNLENELYTLTRIFIAIINKNITKALQFSHAQLLQPNDSKLGNERVTPFVTTYTKTGQKLSSNIHEQ